MPNADLDPTGSERPLLNVVVDAARRVIALRGELDRTTAESFVGSARRLRAEHSGDVRVDLAELTFIGADGLNALVALDRLQRSDGSALVVAPVPSRIERVFRLGRADWLLAA